MLRTGWERFTVDVIDTPNPLFYEVHRVAPEGTSVADAVPNTGDDPVVVLKAAGWAVVPGMETNMTLEVVRIVSMDELQSDFWVRCNVCKSESAWSDILRAPNPFGPEEEFGYDVEVTGCPRCHALDKFQNLCEVGGCAYDAAHFITRYLGGGYVAMWLCEAHTSATRWARR